MKTVIERLLVYLFILLAFGCGDRSGVSESTSPNTALFDPTTGTIPLPNVLATATAKDPLTQYTDPATGNVISRPATASMNPLEALAYVNRYEVGNSNAVSGVNAPIYIRFASALVPSTVNSGNIKVFQVTPDSSSLTATENSPLRFTDITSMFTFEYTAGRSDVSLFPKFPLQPATRYLYLVTNRVKDATTGGSVTGSVYFQALKATAPLGGAFSALESIRANTVNSSGGIAFSGYAKVMDDLIASSGTTTVSSRNEIALLGRFITTAAGFVATDLGNPTGSLVPMETALRAFAAGGDLPGGLSRKKWITDRENAVAVAATSTPASYWATRTGGTVAPPTSVGAVITGTFASADISMNPVVARHRTDPNLNVAFGTYSASTAVVQPFRENGTLTAFYYTPRRIPFVYLAPAGTPPAGGWPVVIFQHGINRQKEDVIAVAGSLTAAGFAVVAIDLPLHNELALAGHTAPLQWTEDFMALGAPLAARSNIQQAAFNLDRLEFVLATPSFSSSLASQGFAALGVNAPNPAIKPKFLGMSLGAIVGTYYLAGNTTLNQTIGQPPYTQATLDSDMKGLLNVTGGRVAYLIRDTPDPDFGPSVTRGLATRGITRGSPSYQQFFLLTQTVLDPVDPATMTTPLPNLQSADLLPSRLSGRVLVQEATSTQFDSAGTPLNGDRVIPNSSTRYFGNALGGRGVLGYDVAPGFYQLSYADGRIPALFMMTLSGGAEVAKSASAAISATATGPKEGYFQFDQSDASHGMLIDAINSPVTIRLVQRQMIYFLTRNIVIDPTVTSTALPRVTVGSAAGLEYRIMVPPVMKVFGSQ